VVAHLLGGLVRVEQGGAAGSAKGVGLLLEGEGGAQGDGGGGGMDPGAVKGALCSDGEMEEAQLLVVVGRARLLLLLRHVCVLLPAASAASLLLLLSLSLLLLLSAAGFLFLFLILFLRSSAMFSPHTCASHSKFDTSSSSKKDVAMTPSALAVASKTSSNAARGSARCLRRAQCSA
jgi:hypothetical protein